MALTNRTIEGWLIKYGQPSLPLTKLPNGRCVYEVILANAFADSIAAINAGVEKIEGNVEHRKNDALMRIGVTGNNVKLEHRTEGVYVTITLADDSVSDDVFSRAESNLARGFSIEFAPSPANAEPAIEIINGNYLRKWSKLILQGFAFTAEPVYPDATVTQVAGGQAPAFSRSCSLSAAEIEIITRDIDALEMERQRTHYKYESFLLGIR